MAITSEEYGDLSQKIPYFDSNPKYQYLADKKLLPQQRGIESFEDAPMLTALRRSLFGMTKAESNLVKQQQEAIIPFEQEQEIKNRLKAAFDFQQQNAPTLGQASAIMPALSGSATPDQQVRPLTGTMSVPTDLVPPTFNIDDLQQRLTVGGLPDLAGSPFLREQPNAAGSYLGGERGIMPLTEKTMAPERSLEVYGQSQVDPNARMNPAQLAAYQSMLAGHVVDPRGPIVPPSLQASRERPHNMSPGEIAISQSGVPIFTAPGKPVKDNEELRKFEGVLEAAGIAKDSPMGKQLYTEWAKKIANPAPSTQVTTNVNTEKKYGEVFSTKVAEMDQSMMDAAQKAPDYAERANRILGVLSNGKVITGTGAEFRLNLAKAMKLAGLAQGEGIEETEALVSDLSSNTLDAIKASGLGSGSGFSNADREFLEKAKGGKITLEGGTLKRLAELAHRAAEKSAQRWNERVKKIPKSALEGTGIDTKPITVPPIQIGGDLDYNRLPSGTRFVGPDGKVRVKP